MPSERDARQDAQSDQWVPLAEVARPHGVRGEVRLKLFNRDSDVLLSLDEILLRLPDGEEHEVSVDGARRADTAILMKLHSIDDRDRADEIRGGLICVKRSDFPTLEDGEFYVFDVIGSNAYVVADEGRLLGVVKDVMTYPTVDTLVISAADGGADWEIPLVGAFVAKVDAENKRVDIAHLDGIEREKKKHS